MNLPIGTGAWVREFLEPLLRIPTAPFLEHGVMDYVRRELRRLAVPFAEDPDGNIMAWLPGAGGGMPVVFAAHMDHPGFAFESGQKRGDVRVRWFGGVAPKYFPGARVEFLWGAERAEVVVTEVLSVNARGRPDEVRGRLESGPLPPAGALGRWAFDGGAVLFKDALVHAPAIDDLTGVAIMLAVLATLRPELGALPGDVGCLFTRAEEVGFVGAIAAEGHGVVPRDALVVSLEASREAPPVVMGHGPVVRVGDASTSFDPQGVHYLTRCAERQRKIDRDFQYQRALMDGGSCESSFFGTAGYRAVGISLPLKNYHNVDRERETLAREAIAEADFLHAVHLAVRVARDTGSFASDWRELQADMAERPRVYEGRLRAQLQPPAPLPGLSPKP